MTKIVYNSSNGGFSLSDAAIEEFGRRKGLTFFIKDSVFGRSRYLDPDFRSFFCDRDISRTDPDLIAIIESLGKVANGRCASLATLELPPGTRYRIDEDDGAESVMTIDDYEWSIA